jgi:hypothetical protein
MRDVELLIRYLAFGRFLEDYGGNLKPFLDLTCRVLNGQWELEEERIREDAQQCESAITATERIFGEGAFRRWTADGWERTFNRAVFDVMAFYFKDPSVAHAAALVADEVVRAFQVLSVDDPGFTESVQTTTKTIGATHKRLRGWGEALSAALDRELPLPGLENNRIRYAPV